MTCPVTASWSSDPRSSGMRGRGRPDRFDLVLEHRDAVRHARRLRHLDTVEYLKRIGVDSNDDRVGLLQSIFQTPDHREASLSGLTDGPRLIIQEDRAVWRNGHVLEARVRDGRITRRQGIGRQDHFCIAVQQRDPVGPGDDDVAVGKDVEVQHGDPMAGSVGIVDTCANLLAACRVGLGDVRPGRDGAANRGQIAPLGKAPRRAVVDERCPMKVVLAAPGIA